MKGWPKGKPLSEETKRKISRSLTGLRPSLETRKKLSEIRRASRHSEETKNKIRLSKIGEKNPAFVCRGIDKNAKNVPNNKREKARTGLYILNKVLMIVPPFLISTIFYHNLPSKGTLTE